jgi:hypothetical protein
MYFCYLIFYKDLISKGISAEVTYDFEIGNLFTIPKHFANVVEIWRNRCETLFIIGYLCPYIF